MRKKKLYHSMSRRICALLLAAVTVFSLAACGKDQGDAGQEEVKEWVYVPEFLAIEEESVSYYNMRMEGDKLYYVSWNWNEETGTSSQSLCYYSLTDKKVESVPLTWPEGEENMGINQIAIGEDGSLYTYANTYSEEKGEQQFICKFDAQGNWQYTKELGTEQNESGVYISYVQNMITDGQGRLYLTGNSGEIMLYDAEGNPAGVVSLGSGDIWVEQIFKGADGKVYVVYNSYDGNGSNTFLAVIDYEGRKVGDSYSNFPRSIRYVASVEEGTFLISDSSKVYEYDLEKQQTTELFDWLDSDINGAYVQCFGQMEDGRLVAVIQDWENEDNGVALLSKTKASEVPQKENITIATISGGYNLRSMAVKFNKASDKYHVSVKEYIDYNSMGENAYADAITNMNNDITSNNTPDIIDLSGISVEQLAAKGVFEDLSGYLDRSSILDRSDFLENVLEAYTYDGKLISVPESFTVQTVIGHKSKIGDRKSWTLQEMVEYADANPDADLFDRVTKGQILQGLLMMNADDFINWSEGTCNFDTDDFKSLLQFVNRYPDEVDYNDDTPVTPIRIQNGEVLLYMESLYDFRSIQEALDMFKQDAVCIGYPTVDGSTGHVLNGRNTYAIASKSNCKDGAWAFIESILSREEDDRYSNGFSARKSKLDAMAAKAVEVKYVLDENGEPYLDENGEPIIEGAGGGIGWGDWFYEYHLPTQEEVDMVMEIIKEARPIIYDSNNQIMSIVLEEAEPFFKGQKSADEVAGIIQNRANIYINENR